MKLVHDKHGETTVSSDQEARRLAQYGWSKAPQDKPSRKRKPVEPQPELPTEDAPETE